jgi:UPF0755 protein
MYKRYAAAVANRGRMPWRVLAVIAVLLVSFIIAAFAVRNYYFNALEPVSDSQEVKIVNIESGTPATEIGTMLQSQGLIKSATAFQWYIRTNNLRDKMQAGTYALRPSMSVQQIVDVLVSGTVKSDLLTILPGQRLDQVRQTFINAGYSPESVDAALDPAQYAGHPALADKPAGASLEGFLYPDSYQKDANTDPKAIIGESLDEMADHLTPGIRASFAKQGLSVFQGVILASMVEKEVSKPSDRKQVAQVFLSRLNQDMLLGSDVTAYYGAIVAGKESSVLYDSPYNTRLHKGLPVGPISNASESSLQAVAEPANTNWLYFVAGDDGITYFSKTLEEHVALTKEHCHELCAPE